MKIIEYARAKKLSILDAAHELDKQYSVEIYLTEQIEADLKSYKEQTNMIEFSDMIKQFIEKDKCPPLSDHTLQGTTIKLSIRFKALMKIYL